MIEINLLRYAVAAADAGSFSRAAQQFGIKQTTLSKHVLYLEDRVGERLFRRSTRGVVPTNLGEGFLRRARRIVSDVEALDRECAESARGSSSPLRFGFQGSLQRGELSSLFRTFRSAFPNIEIAAREQGRAQLLRALERDELDLAVIGGYCGGSELNSLPLWHAPVILGLAANQGLVDRDQIYWTDLRACRFIVTAEDPGPELSAIVTSRLFGPGHRPSVIVQHVRSSNLPAFASGDSVVLLAEPCSEPGSRCAFRPVHDTFGPTVIEYRLHWRRGNDSAALRLLLDLLAERRGLVSPQSEPGGARHRITGMVEGG